MIDGKSRVYVNFTPNFFLSFELFKYLNPIYRDFKPPEGRGDTAKRYPPPPRQGYRGGNNMKINKVKKILKKTCTGLK